MILKQFHRKPTFPLDHEMISTSHNELVGFVKHILLVTPFLTQDYDFYFQDEKLEFQIYHISFENFHWLHP